MSRKSHLLGIALAFQLVIACSSTIVDARPQQSAAPSVNDYSSQGPCQVVEHRGVWTDVQRSRDVPWLIRMPERCVSGPKAVVLLSHGLGGSREGLSRISRHLASHGFAVAHVQHLGSDTAVWRGRRPTLETVTQAQLQAMVANPRVTLNRFEDVPFAMQMLAVENREGPLKGQLDLDRVAMGGHSYGAVTTQAMAGQRFANGRSMQELPFKSYIVLSPSGDRAGRDHDGVAFAGLRGPILFLTGTQDNTNISPMANPSAERRRPFDALPPNVAGSLITLDKGDHFVFDGQALAGVNRPTDARHHVLIDSAILAFAAATLHNNSQARDWLVKGGYAAYAGSDLVIEHKGWR